MASFTISLGKDMTIRFACYEEEAPVTSAAFLALLPFTRVFYHARVSGQEIWFDDLPPLDIIQENASVFTKPGEVVLGPSKPERVKTANCLGIYYGEGRGLDAANIFAHVYPEDLRLLQKLGNQIWRHGAMEITMKVL
ncbi:DUF3830 family protein [Pollutibacter soli]|uniref:DUF3830 family protein n=1 Tax=Pollutibacter soli TaxID=3034157 RepID=UPI0030138D6A